MVVEARRSFGLGDGDGGGEIVSTGAVSSATGTAKSRFFRFLIEKAESALVYR
jgi:hypothetical protein